MGIYFKSYNNVYVRIMNCAEDESETNAKGRTITCVDGLAYESMPNSVILETGMAFSDYFKWRESIQSLARAYNLTRVFRIPDMKYNDFLHSNKVTQGVSYFLDLICEKIKNETRESLFELCNFSRRDKLFTFELRKVYANCNQKGAIIIW